MLKIVTLMENKSSKNRALVPAHGLSFYIEFNNKKYLFDCGPDEKFIENALNLGIDLNNLNGVIISHSHFDHGGGYRKLLDNKYLHKYLYTGESFFERKYNSKNNTAFTDMSCGISEHLLNEYNIVNIKCSDTLKMDNNMYIAGNFKRTFPFEIIPEKFVKLCNDDIRKDDFSDEICLVFKTSCGLVVIVGCSHPGIVNMLNDIKDRFGEKIYAVYGGTHLMDANDLRISETIKSLKSMGVKILGLCHCTGEYAENILINDRSINSCHISVGDTVFIK